MAPPVAKAQPPTEEPAPPAAEPEPVAPATESETAPAPEAPEAPKSVVLKSPRVAPEAPEPREPPQDAAAAAAEEGRNDVENPGAVAAAGPPKKKKETEKEKKEREINPKFKDVQETGKWGDVNKCEVYTAICVCLVVVVGVAVGVYFGIDGGTVTEPAVRPTAPPTMAPTTIDINKELQLALAAIDASDFTYQYLADLPATPDFYKGLMEDASATPQQRAMSWLLHEDERDNSAEVVSRWALASIYYSTGGEDWTSAEGWLSSVSICEWEHIDCNGITPSLQEIVLASNNLVGTIPSEIALIGDTIQSIWLRNNQLTGTIPGDALGSLPRLSILYMNGNQLTGTVSKSLRSNGALNSLFVQENNLTGDWPRDFCPATVSSAKPIQNFGLDCDDVVCLPGCCDDYSCYYQN